VTEVLRRIVGFEIRGLPVFPVLPALPLPSTNRTTRLSPRRRLSRSPYVSTTTSPFALHGARSRLKDEASTVTDGYQASGNRRPRHHPFCQSWGH
jgi:hypothetical protein